MGGMCSPSGGINEPAEGKVGSLNKRDKPDSRTDLNNENGELIQSNWYDSDGWVMWSRDYGHGGGAHTFPHDHSWKWNKEIGELLDRSKELSVNEGYC